MPENLQRLRVLTEDLTSPELLVRLVDNLPDALVVVDRHGEIVLFNGMAELLFGYHRSEVLGESVDVLVPEGLRDRHACDRSEFIEEPRSRPMGHDMTLSGRHKDGYEIPVAINLSPLQTPDGLYVSAVIRRRRT